MANACKHDHLSFDQGGLYLVCDNCKYVYAAVGHCPQRIIQDFMARGLPFQGQKRSNPSAGPLVKTTIVKKPVQKPQRPSEQLIEAVQAQARREAPLPPKTIVIKPKTISKKSS